jgi:hypothetical protein
MSELLPPEISILAPRVKNLIRILNDERQQFTFTDFQIMLSNTATLLPYSTTATIINILKSRKAITERTNGKRRYFEVDKEALRKIINALTGG